MQPLADNLEAETYETFENDTIKYYIYIYMKTHLPLPGITLNDCSKKEGLDGIDNGFMIFNNVRIPKENLLNRFSSFTDDGKF